MTSTTPGVELERWFGYTGQRLIANQPFYAKVSPALYAQTQQSVLTAPAANPERSVYFTQGPGLASLPLITDDEAAAQSYVWIPSSADESRSLTTAVFHPTGAFVAVADARLQSQLAIYSWPERRLVHKIDQAARLSVADMTWSRKGTHFAVLSSAPLHNLTVYAVDPASGKLVQQIVSQKEQANDHQYNAVSFSPRSTNEICTSGGGHIAFWHIDTPEEGATAITTAAITLDCVEGSVTDQGSWRITCHSWLITPNTVVAGTVSGHLFLFDSATGVGTIAPAFADRVHDVGDEDSSIVGILLTKHNVVTLNAGGVLRFYNHDVTAEIRSVQVPVASAATTMAFTAHDTFAIGTVGGTIHTVVVPGYGSQGAAGGPLSPEELRLAAPRIGVVEEGFGSDVVSACALPSTTEAVVIAAVSADGVLRVRDATKNRVEVRMHIGKSPTSLVLLPNSGAFNSFGGAASTSNGATVHVLLAAFATGTIRYIELSSTPSGYTARVARQLRVTTDKEQQHVENWHNRHRAPGSVAPPAFRLFVSSLGYGSAARPATAAQAYVLGLFGLFIYILEPSARNAVAVIRVPSVFDGIHDLTFFPAAHAATQPDLNVMLSTLNSTIIYLKVPGDISVSASSSSTAGVTFDTDTTAEGTATTSEDTPASASAATTLGGATAESSDLALPVLSWDRAFVNRWRCELPMVRIAVLSVFESNAVNMLGQSLDRETKFFSIDLTLAANRKDADTKGLKLPAVFPDHAKACSSLMTIDSRVLVTTGTDGRVVVRNVSALAAQSFNAKDSKRDAPFMVTRHPSLLGGIKCATVSSTGRHFITVGGDGSIIVWNFSAVATPSQGSNAPRVAAPPGTIGLPWRAFSAAAPAPVKSAPRVLQPEEELFFKESMRREAEEADRIKHEAHRREVLAKVAVFRERLRLVRAENDQAAEEEKVETEGFLVERDLNLFQQQVSKAVAEMQDQVKYSDLMADYVAAMLKRDCWDSMQAKLTPLIGMANRNLRVYSAHQRANDPARVALLRKIKFLRRVEETDRAARGVHELDNLVATPGGDQDAAATNADGSEIATTNVLASKLTDLDEKMISADAEFNENVEPYLYRATLTFTRQRAVTQIRLLEARTGNVVRAFNARFADLVAVKKAEIAKIRERNLRCTQVCRELEQPPNFFTCEMTREETPETILEVTDAEVPVDKSHDPTEKARLAVEEAEKERWRRQHGNDDSSERALKQWMDGRLEKEIKTLVVDVPMPEFAIEGNAKYVPESDRNDDQQRIYKEYEKKRAKREEEVATRRKFLQQELAALQKENLDCATKFDTQLQQLLLARLEASQQASRVDLQRVKLVQSIALHRDRNTVLSQLESLRSSLNSKLVRASQATIRFRRELDSKKEQLANLISDEKAAERGLRTMEPFNESEEAADRLAKMYAGAKKKALAGAGGREGGRGQKGRGKGNQVEDPYILSRASVDPFGFVDAEVDAKTKAQNDEATTTATQFQKLDRATAGEIVPDHLWDAFQNYLQDRLDGERQIRRLQQQVQEMAAEEQRLTEVEEALRSAAVKAADDLTQFRHDARDESYDVDELRLYRQGQVEVAQAPVVTDYADAVLIHVRDIHALNAAIRQRGARKVEAMKAMNEQRAHARFLDWELEKLQYQCETLELECRHLHTLRVTKQMQEFIHGGGEGYNERERAKLTAKIEHVRTTMSTKIEEKKQLMTKVKRATRERELENDVLVDQVDEAESLVQSRRSVRDLQSSELERERHARLMRDMRVTRKLEDVAKAQQEEMEALRKEIDRLRERTFPSFAVVSKRVIGNPDERS